MIIHNMPQKSKEWFEVKKGKLGASHAQCIQAQGKGLETYILELMSENYSSAERESYINSHMERGNELEEQARSIYELETGNEVSEVGFIEYDDYVGCSPDGLVGEDGLMEIKCPSDKVYFQYLLDGIVDKKYYYQMQMQMMITGRNWCDYVVYNPNYKKSIIIKRIEKDNEAFNKLFKGFEIAKHKINEIKKTLKEGIDENVN